MTLPIRNAFRPTTTLAGPGTVSALQWRHFVLLVVCWLLWYVAAGYALDTIVSRLAPRP